MLIAATFMCKRPQGGKGLFVEFTKMHCGDSHVGGQESGLNGWLGQKSGFNPIITVKTRYV